ITTPLFEVNAGSSISRFAREAAALDRRHQVADVNPQSRYWVLRVAHRAGRMKLDAGSLLATAAGLPPLGHCGHALSSLMIFSMNAAESSGLIACSRMVFTASSKPWTSASSYTKVD